MSKYNLKAIKEDFKNKGIFYTPKELGLYLKQFLPDKIESIYDQTTPIMIQRLSHLFVQKPLISIEI